MKNSIILIFIYLFITLIPVTASPESICLETDMEHTAINTVEVSLVSKTEKDERKSPLLSYLERIERSLERSKTIPLTKERKQTIINQLKEKQRTTCKRREYLTKRARKIKSDINEIELFQKISTSLLKKLEKLVPAKEIDQKKVIRK